MSVEADAFKALYPEQYFARFFERDTRPDGRSLRRARPTVIGFKAVSSADSSALVKIGSTTALCTLNLQVSNPSPAQTHHPGLDVLVEITPLCQRANSSTTLADWGKTVARQVERILLRAQLLPDDQLRIPDSVARWKASLRVTVLDADGCVFDAAFLACVAALQFVRVPEVDVDSLQRAKRKETPPDDASLLRRFSLACRPVSLTLGCLGSALVADPTGEEEAVMKGVVTAVVSESGDLAGLFQTGDVGMENIRKAIRIAQSRQKEVDVLFEQAMQGA